jgi:hypothetical protein
MIAVVTAEAARIAHVTNVVGVRSPRHLHIGKDVLVIEGQLLWPVPRDARIDRRP